MGGKEDAPPPTQEHPDGLEAAATESGLSRTSQETRHIWPTSHAGILLPSHKGWGCATPVDPKSVASDALRFALGKTGLCHLHETCHCGWCLPRAGCRQPFLGSTLVFLLMQTLYRTLQPQGSSQLLEVRFGHLLFQMRPRAPWKWLKRAKSLVVFLKRKGGFSRS